MRQSAEGWFGWDDALIGGSYAGQTWDGRSYRKELEALIGTLEADLKKKVLATALTLRVFEECFADQHDLWRLAADKARRWLGKVAPEAARWCAPGHGRTRSRP